MSIENLSNISDGKVPENYNPSDYPPFAVTVDLNIFTIKDGVLKILLVERKADPFKNFWALPGGFINVDESAEDAARRELSEETGINIELLNNSRKIVKVENGKDVIENIEDLIHLEQLKTYSSPNRDPRMRVVSISYIAFASDLPEPVAGDDAANARWWAVEDILSDSSEISLAFDHNSIIVDALDRVRSKLEYTTLATQFVCDTFTLSDLWRVYKTVWGEDDAPVITNFRRKVLSVNGFVEPLGEKTIVNTGQKALLYKKGNALKIYPPFIRGQE